MGDNMSEDIFLANRGIRKDFFLKLVRIDDKGEYKIHRLVDRTGREAMFYRCSGDVSFEVNDCILIKATVAEHREYKNVPFSYLNRVKILENKGSVK